MCVGNLPACVSGTVCIMESAFSLCLSPQEVTSSALPTSPTRGEFWPAKYSTSLAYKKVHYYCADQVKSKPKEHVGIIIII